MKKRSFTILSYALIIMLGGLMGFIKAASLASLIMSSIFGILLIMSAIAMYRGHGWGFYCAFSLTITLLAFFAYRYFLTQQFFPSGIMLLISMLMIGNLLFTKREPSIQ